MPTLSARTDLSAPPYLTYLLTGGGHSLRADEPLVAGGGDQAPSPGELLAASLGACTCITVRLYSERKAWPLEAVEALVTFEKADNHVIHRLQQTLYLLGALSDEQRKRLLVIAEHCPIHKAISGSIEIATALG